ncbi:MAG: tRNA lysidine(34) synthetase TilS [Opitutaceae bacterium]|jgi:tRNA(Ile)-lysidine synthase|nr:tRNA lysidine(34) synthetase TilS [Opitutaceae bacterium]
MDSAEPMDWRLRASSLAERIPMALLHPTVVAATRAGGAAAKSRWAVALSGGCDSVALLLLLWAHWPNRRDRLLALHFNHGLRGRNSDEDARFCRSLCRSLGIPFRSQRWKRQSTRPVTEAAAREARFDFFRRAMERDSSRVLWLGHHQDDVAETLVMRLGRGSGLAGLVAPRPLQLSNDKIIRLRPLLTLSKRTLVEHLAGLGIPWREDESNQTDQFLRNRVRNHVLPAWLAAEPGRDIVSGMAASRELLQEDADALDTLSASIGALRRSRIDLRKLKGVPKALVRRVLYKWKLSLKDRCGDLSKQGFEALLAAVMAQRDTRLSLGASGFAVIQAFTLTYERVVPKSRR